MLVPLDDQHDQIFSFYLLCRYSLMFLKVRHIKIGLWKINLKIFGNDPYFFIFSKIGWVLVILHIKNHVCWNVLHEKMFEGKKWCWEESKLNYNCVLNLLERTSLSLSNLVLSCVCVLQLLVDAITIEGLMDGLIFRTNQMFQ